MALAHRSRNSLVHRATLAGILLFAASPATAQRRAVSIRRGAPATAVTPTADAAITLGGAQYQGSVDANCTRDERATATNGRFYYHIMYPWFGAHPAPGQPQWSFELDVSRPTGPAAFDSFMFFFHDGARSGTIQEMKNAKRMGSGTVRVTPHGAGARFEVAGRSQEGETVRATIDCAAFPASEAAGG
jgi:hypothetical protein